MLSSYRGINTMSSPLLCSSLDPNVKTAGIKPSTIRNEITTHVCSENTTKNTHCISIDSNSDVAHRATSARAKEDREGAFDKNISTQVFEKARKIVAERFEGSTYGDCLDSAFSRIPRMSKNELALGKRLGKGSFSNVDEIRGIVLNRSSLCTTRSSSHGSWFASSNMKILSSHSTTPCLDHPTVFESSERVAPTMLAEAMASGVPSALKRIPRPGKRIERQDTVASGNHETRVFMQKHCFRNSGECRYAIKMVRRDVFQNKDNEKDMVAGICDLAIETFFLSFLEHPNIIKLRAAADICHPFTSDYFLVLDRLKETLSRRIHQNWKLKEKCLYSFWGRCRDRKGAKRLAFFDHRLERAYDLGCAIEYLHQKKIIHRDIKPDNIGFDIRDDIKLFDFGMGRELNDDLKADDENFRLTFCGSPRYMAPEVWTKSPYNSAADVYSFGIVLFEMIALRRAFDDCDATNFAALVVKNDTRPDLDIVRAPPSIKSLFPHLWHANAQYRCDMPRANLATRTELTLLRSGDESRLPDFTRRRSTFIYTQRGSKKNDKGSSSFAASVDSILSPPANEHKRSVANIKTSSFSGLSSGTSSNSIKSYVGA